MASFGLSVDRKYRGRGIGEQLLGARFVISILLVQVSEYELIN